MQASHSKVRRLAAFVESARFEHIPAAAVEQLEIRILDALGCAIGAIESDPPARLRRHVVDFGGARLCTLIGGGTLTAPDRAAFYNGALVRYLDFNDSYLAAHETCHPSDNLAAVLAAAEYANRSGRELLTALAVAYQVQCRLSDAAPVRAKGFDHVTQLAHSAAAGAACALGLDAARTAHAIATAGTALNALRVTRTGKLSHWKGLAAPYAAHGALEAAFLALHGIEGPDLMYEGNKGFEDAIAGRFEIDWSHESLSRVTRTIVKRYNAEVHSQSAIEAALELREQYRIDPETIERIHLDIFDVAYNIIGGGEEGAKTKVLTKEEADHSLPYLIAVALLDGQVLPEQYQPERIVKRDVQSLLQRVEVRPDPALSQRFPHEMPARLRIELRDGRRFEIEKPDYEGFTSRPTTWAGAVAKFETLAAPHASQALQRELCDTVATLDRHSVADLTHLLARIRGAELVTGERHEPPRLEEIRG